MKYHVHLSQSYSLPKDNWLRIAATCTNRVVRVVSLGEVVMQRTGEIETKRKQNE